MADNLSKQLESLSARMSALMSGHQHSEEMAFGVQARLPSYAGLDDMREDRAEYREIAELNSLRDRLDEIQEAEQRTQSQSHGMEWS